MELSRDDLSRIQCVYTIIFKKFCYAFSRVVPGMQMSVVSVNMYLYQLPEWLFSTLLGKHINTKTLNRFTPRYSEPWPGSCHPFYHFFFSFYSHSSIPNFSSMNGLYSNLTAVIILLTFLLLFLRS